MLLYPANSDTACENLFSPCRVNKCDFHNFQLLVVFTMSVEVKKNPFLEENTFDCMTRIT